MYNRYIPQDDGSYRKNRVQEHQQKPEHPPAPPAKRAESQHASHAPEPEKIHSPARSQGGSVTGFLRQLLPKGFDTGDLLIVLMLLLMAGDCQEEQNTALLTLAIYLYM